MAIDYILNYPCALKNELGNGDVITGTLTILDSLKARYQSHLIQNLAEQDDKKAEELEVHVQLTSINNETNTQKISVAELAKKSSLLNEWQDSCTDCIVNQEERAFSCFGVIKYPITIRAENWLISRLEKSSTFGKSLCLRYFSDIQIERQGIDSLRSEGLFDAKNAKIVKISKGKTQSLNSSQLFHSLFLVGSSISPDHSIGVLLWLDAIRLDGNKITQDALPGLLSLSTEERLDRVSLKLGPVPSDEGSTSIYKFIECMFRSWCFQLPILLSV